MPTPRSAALSWVGRWGTADAADPRPTQAIFAVLFVADWLAQRDSGSIGSGNLFTLGAIVVLTLATATTPWPRFEDRGLLRALGFLAVGDIVATGVHFSSCPGSASIVLIGMPALWLGRLGYPGVIACVIGTAVGVIPPGYLYTGTTAQDLMRVLLPALVALIVTTAKAAAVERDRYHARVMEALVETVDIGLQLVDTTGRTLRSNGQVPPQHAPGSDAHAVLGATSPTLRAARGEAINGLLVPMNDPRQTVFSVSTRPVHDRNGRQVAAAIAWQDVTPLVEALNEDRHLLATVSHDLRTPLTAIRGYAEILRTHPMTPEAERMLDVIHNSSQRIEFLIGDLLAAASARREHSLQRTPVDLVTLIHDAVDAIQPLANQAQVTITTTAPPTLISHLDSDRFHRVIDNLLSNAVKYNRPGGHVKLTVESYDQPQRFSLTVADNGIGIPQEAIPHIFDRRYRVQEVQDTLPGSGLGLSIVKDIIDAHHGAINVDSKLEAGTRVTITLSY